MICVVKIIDYTNRFMHKTILLIILFLLLICMFVLSYFKFFGGTNGSEVSGNSNMNASPISYWNSYYRETYDDNGLVVDTSNKQNYYIEVDDSRMTICTYEPSNCDDFEYSKENGTYVMHTDNKKLLNANLTIQDDTDKENGSIIKIIKTYDDEEGGYSIFYFKRNDEESSE